MHVPLYLNESKSEAEKSMKICAYQSNACSLILTSTCELPVKVLISSILIMV